MRNCIIAIILMLILAICSVWCSTGYVYFQKELLFKWAADTRITTNPYPINYNQLEIVNRQLQPGDIILTRRNGFVSNLFIPGYWTHSALYIGKDENKYFNNDPCVIEALSEGIITRPLEESLQVNAFIIFRPIIPKEDIDIAIKNALKQKGKPYDYDFDFSTNDRLSCTELIYHSYGHTKLIVEHELFGRLFTTPNEIIEDYNNQKGSSDQKLEFVLQMDENGVLENKVNKLLAKTSKFSFLIP